ncbi:MAG: ABC transporter substrate-binding protein [Desulfovibrionaceae bacterium]
MHAPCTAEPFTLRQEHTCTPDTPLTENDAAAEKTVRILLQWMPQAQFAGYIMAQERGFFAEEGLSRVELHWAQLGESPLRILAKGDMDFATAWLVSGLQRWGEGLPIVNIRQFMQHSGSVLIARKSSNIEKIEDLNGKTILTWGSDFGLEFELFLKRNAIIPGKVLPLSNSLAPFLYGLADATQAMDYSEYLRLLERGMKAEEMTIFPFAQYKVDLAGDGLYTRVNYLQENRKIVQGVLRAVERGWDYAFTHEDETVDAVLCAGDARKFRSNRNYQLQMLRSIRMLMQGYDGTPGELARKDFEAARAAVIESGLALHDESYERFFQRP